MRRGVVALLIAGVLAGCGTGGGTPQVDPALSALLQQTWATYRTRFISSGRVVDPGRDNATTSEGQSYAMLRAVWMDDRATFDIVWAWTRHNLQTRPGDKLLSYLWTRVGDHYGVTDVNSASDADEDVALALVFAAKRWSDPTYGVMATAIVRDIWRVEVAVMQRTPYLTAGNWAPKGAPHGPVLNPSYLAPYAYRVFATVDRGHDWHGVIDSSYRALDRCTSARLDGGEPGLLPPNWCVINAATGAAESFQGPMGPDGYGYDAFRVMWRIALDERWNNAPAAKDYLQRTDALRTALAMHGTIVAEYAHDGTPSNNWEDPTIYGGDIGDFVVAAPDVANSILKNKLLRSVARDGGNVWFGDARSYYEQNWVWFGVALTANALANLTLTPPSP